MSNIERFAEMVRDDEQLQARVAEAGSPDEVAAIANQSGVAVTSGEVVGAFGDGAIAALGADELSAIAGGAPNDGPGGGGGQTEAIGCPTGTWDECYTC